jgi:hypothetical protein
MRKAKTLAAAVFCWMAGAALAQNPCSDCRNDALSQHKACNAAAKDAAASQACGKKMRDLMQACQVGACAKDVAKIYSGYCEGCLKQADTPAKKKACEESICKQAAQK